MVHGRILTWFLSFLLVPGVLAGGTGFNVLVVANQSSSNSLALANYYAEKRGVPPQNILHINWTGNRTVWSYADFSTALLTPLQTMLTGRQLTNQADFLVLSMDIPYRTLLGSTYNSTTAVLYYGFKTNGPAPGPGLPESCSLPTASGSDHAGSELPFRATNPGSAGPTNLLTTMITASNLALAKLTVDQGTAGDFSFSTQTVWLAKGWDYDRNSRYWLFDDAIFNARLQGNYSMRRTDNAGPSGLGNVLGFQGGAYNYGVVNAWFVPGAMADNLTSFGGQIFQDNGGQLNILTLMAAGASGSYGTIEEPCLYHSKFPAPQVFFYQSRGFTLAESYYLSVTNPYQGLVLGEPLSAPFASRGQGAWSLARGAVLRGITNLTVNFTAADSQRPLQRVDLFIDGRWDRTLTNSTPAAGNVLQASLNGHTVIYTVSPDATLASVAAGWASHFNAQKDLTQVTAEAHGDRIELQCIDLAAAGPLPISVQSLPGSAVTASTFARAAQNAFLTSTASGIRACEVSGTPAPGATMGLTVTRTNGLMTSFTVTNSGSLTLFNLAQQLQSAMNSSPLAAEPDGLRMIDVIDRSIPAGPRVEFNLEANSSGWPAAQIEAAGTGSFTFSPSGVMRLDQQVGDLRPRNQLFLSTGHFQLPLAFAFDSTRQPDGYHELVVVATEGTSIQTRTPVVFPVCIENHAWSATLETIYGDATTALETTLIFQVQASTPNISRIELFSTGGGAGLVIGKSNAVFEVTGGSLGEGLHPFYALVTTSNDEQYRTETKWIRLTSETPAFRLHATAPPLILTWRAVAGKLYEVLGATGVTGPYRSLATVTPSNSTGCWADSDSNGQRFYRLDTIP